MAEAGFAPIIDVAWVAVLYPAAVPPAVLAKVNADIRRVMALPAFQQRLAAAGFDPIGGDVEQARAYVAEELRNWREVVRTINIQID